MSASIYLFTREIHENGRRLNQAVSVYAKDGREANRILRMELRQMRKQQRERDPKRHEPSLQERPEWFLTQFSLDTPKIVSFLVTS